MTPTRAARPLFSLRRLVLGRPLANWKAGAASLGPVTGVPAMGLDAFSAACVPEAARPALAGAIAEGGGLDAGHDRRGGGDARRATPVLLANHRRLSRQHRLLHRRAPQLG